MSKEQKSLDYGIQKERIIHLFPTQMHIGQVVVTHYFRVLFYCL
jgi:hypothetical protein